MAYVLTVDVDNLFGSFKAGDDVSGWPVEMLRTLAGVAPPAVAEVAADAPDSDGGVEGDASVGDEGPTTTATVLRKSRTGAGGAT